MALLVPDTWAFGVFDHSGPSFLEFHRCTVVNGTTGKFYEDDPQGEGGAFVVGYGSTLVLDDSLVINSYAGKKVIVFISSLFSRPGGGKYSILRIPWSWHHCRRISTETDRNARYLPALLHFTETISTTVPATTLLRIC